MEAQMTIFDFLPKPDDPIRNAIKHMHPHWTNSRQTIVDAYGTNGFIQTVKHEYNPYGGSGFYGGDFGRKGVFTLTGWEMRDKGIVFQYRPYMVEEMTWAQFAKQIKDLIRTGEFLNERQ